MIKFDIVVQYVRYLARRFVEDGCMQRASSLTYTTLFAVVPMMTVTYSMLSAVPSLQGVDEQIQKFLFENFVPSTGAAVEEYLHGFSRQARQLTAVGIAILVITAYLMLRSIEGALNAIWRVDSGRRGISGFLLYWAILSLGPLLLGLGFAMTSYIASLKLISDTTSFLGIDTWLFRLLPFLLSIAAFCLIYMAVPNRRVPFTHALIGGVFVALLFEVAKGLFALFISLSPSYQLIYGAFAAVPLFLIWIYLSWLIVLLGAELVRSFSDLPAILVKQRLPDVVQALLVLEAFDRAFAEGKQMSRETFRRQWPISTESWEACCRALGKQGLLREDKGDWFLAQNLASVEVWTMMRRLPWTIPSPQAVLKEHAELPPWLQGLLQDLQRFDERGQQMFSISLSELYGSRTEDVSGSLETETVNQRGSG